MYCSTCGVTVAPGLSYCNHCGAKLNRSEVVKKSPEFRPEPLLGAITFVFVFGLAAITMLVGVMKAVLEVASGVIIGFALLSFLLMFVIEAVFIRMLVRRSRAANEEKQPSLEIPYATKELGAERVGKLPEPVPSVTEHTTRTIKPAYNNNR